MFTRTVIIPVLMFGLALAACAPSQPSPTPVPNDLPPVQLPAPVGEVNNPAVTLPVTDTLTPSNMEIYLPQPADAGWLTGTVYLDTTDVLALESFPPQYILRLTGSLPNPCHQLRVVVSDLADGKRPVQVYSVAEPDQMCIQVLQPFEVNVPLGSATDPFDVVINAETTIEVR